MNQFNSDIEDETLVAFLDGELSTEEVRDLTQRISTDPALRQRVESLRSSWEMLEELPVAKPNLQLAQTTIELITQGMGKTTKEKCIEYLSRYRWLWLSVASLAALSVGWSVSRSQANRSLQSIVDDLAILANYRDLDNIDSEAWLEKLEKIENLEKAGLPLYSETRFPLLPKTRDDLQDWTAGLDTEHKLSLQKAYRSFFASTSERQSMLRTMAKTIDGSQSSKAVKAYAGLLQKISIAEATQISAESDLEIRTKQVQNVVRRELAISYANNLSELEKSRIIDWCDTLKESNFDSFLNVDDSDAEIIRLLDVESTDSGIAAEDVSRLVSCVDPEGQKLLESLDTSLQTKLLKLWVYNSLPSTQPKPVYTSAELLERFYKMPLEAQNEMIFSPSSEVIKSLSQDQGQAESLKMIEGN